MERVIINSSTTLGMDAMDLAEHIWTLPKPQDVANLQARIDCLLKENGKLKTQLAAKKTQLIAKETKLAAKESDLANTWK